MLNIRKFAYILWIFAGGCIIIQLTITRGRAQQYGRRTQFKRLHCLGEKSALTA